MEAQAYEEDIELEVGLFEVERATDPDDPRHRASYPMPLVVPTGAVERRSFRGVVLENERLRVIVIPELGGRILSAKDKPLGVELLPRPQTLVPVDKGLDAGIRLGLFGRDLSRSLGRVQTLTLPPESGEPGTIWIGDLEPGTGLSWNMRLRLAPDAAEIEIEARIFNRDLKPSSYNSGLLLPAGQSHGQAPDEAWTHFAATSALVAIDAEAPFDGLELDQAVAFSRFAHNRDLGPRQLDIWRCRIGFFAGIGTPLAASVDAAAELSDDALVLYSLRALQGKAVIRTIDGHVLEAPVRIAPDQPEELSLPKSHLQDLVLLDEHRRVRLRWPTAPPPPTLYASGGCSKSVASLNSTERELRALSFEVEHRPLAHTLLGMQALRAADYAGAANELETALLFNAEDHLNWVLKAIAERLAGTSSETECPELLNAHYLAPLEPALRMEGFLSQPSMMDREGSPLVRPLDGEAMADLACLLLECGLFKEAARWLDEAIRHQDVPLLRYLLAYAHLEGSQMEATAAEQILLASGKGLSAPFPWRDLEWRALARLRERFPEDAKLAAFAALEAIARGKSCDAAGGTPPDAG